MANKRMFSIDVVDTDKFLDMPVSTQVYHRSITVQTSQSLILEHTKAEWIISGRLL